MVATVLSQVNHLKVEGTGAGGTETAAQNYGDQPVSKAPGCPRSSVSLVGPVGLRRRRTALMVIATSIMPASDSVNGSGTSSNSWKDPLRAVATPFPRFGLLRANGPSVYIAQAECLGSCRSAIKRAKGPTVCRSSPQRAGPLALTVRGHPFTQSDGLGYANGGALPLGGRTGDTERPEPVSAFTPRPNLRVGSLRRGFARDLWNQHFPKRTKPRILLKSLTRSRCLRLTAASVSLPDTQSLPPSHFVRVNYAAQRVNVRVGAQVFVPPNGARMAQWKGFR